MKILPIRFPWKKPAMVDRLRRHWSQQKYLHVNAGIPRETIQLFESTNQVSLTEDFSQYLQAFNGFNLERSDSLESCDDEAFAFYPIENLMPIDGAAKHYKFCDNWVLLHSYAICLDSGSMFGKVTIIESGGLYHCAQSFSQFVDLYIANSKALYRAGPMLVEFSDRPHTSGPINAND